MLRLVDQDWTMDGGDHQHGVVAGATGAGSAHSHSVGGSTASGGSASQSVLNPYRGWYFVTYVGT